jgi:hypothetical protein
VSLVYVHQFSISLDGFGTGEGQSRDAYFGHAGDRLHEWMFTTRWWNEQVGLQDDRGRHSQTGPLDAYSGAGSSPQVGEPMRDVAGVSPGSTPVPQVDRPTATTRQYRHSS